MGLQKKPFVVTTPEHGQELITFLAAKLSLSRRRAKELLDRRNVFVNDRRVWMARHTLKAGDSVAAFLDEAAPSAPQSPNLLEILFEDGRYLVVDKPPGHLSNGADSVESRLREQTGRPELRAVHRLDRDTSGCLLFAENDTLFGLMVEQFRAGRIGKIYHAIVAGPIASDTVIDKPLDNLKAVTRLHVMNANRLASHIEVKIETGRTHQIRKHLSMIRHPVLGDRQYGTSGPQVAAYQGIARHMLHAFRLEFPHSEKDDLIRVESPLPQDIRAVMNRLDLT